MDTISPQTLRYVEQTPHFREAIEDAKSVGTTYPQVTITLADFDDDPLRLYACILYARHAGVYLIFAP